MYGTKGHEESKGATSNFIAPGICDVTITAINLPDAAYTGSPYFEMVFTDVTGKTAPIRFYMNPDVREGAKKSAYEISMGKIKHIATKVVTEAQIDNVAGNNLNEYAMNLSKLLINKKLKMKFVGTEVKGKEGKQNWFKAELGFAPFAETTDTMPSKLTFDINGRFDMKRIPGNVNGTFSPAQKMVEDLPF